MDAPGVRVEGRRITFAEAKARTVEVRLGKGRRPAEIVRELSWDPVEHEWK